MREVNYNEILVNIDEMINALEYSAQRSGGKLKQAVPDLVNLYQYKEIIKNKLNSKTLDKVKKDKK